MTRSHEQHQPIDALSPRQWEHISNRLSLSAGELNVLRGVWSGQDQIGIAQLTGIPVQIVEATWQALKRKLNVSGPVGAADVINRTLREIEAKPASRP